MNLGPDREQLNSELREYLRHKLSTAIGERRHHEHLYTQSFVGGMVILGIYLVGFDTVVTRQASGCSKHAVLASALVLGFALAGLFYWHALAQHDKRTNCAAIIKRLEGILARDSSTEAERNTEIEQGVIEEKELKNTKLKELLTPKSRWQWIYVIMVTITLVVLAFAYQ